MRDAFNHIGRQCNRLTEQRSRVLNRRERIARSVVERRQTLLRLCYRDFPSMQALPDLRGLPLA